MSYEYLPKSLQADKSPTKTPADDDNNAVVPNDKNELARAGSLSEQLIQAEELLKAKIESQERYSEGWMNHMFLLGQLFYEHSKFQQSFDTFRDLVESPTSSVFVRQAQYQLAILGFDKKLNDSAEAFRQLSVLISSGKDDLFTVCSNYNLGLATFNGFNPTVPSGEVIPAAREYWIRAAGGDEHSLSQPTNVKALDIVMPKTQQVDADAQEMLFFRALAQCKLGQLYSYESEHKDEARAFFWHTEAAGNGNVESQGVLGVMYLYGIGVNRNEKSGLYCLKAAAGGNNLYAMGRLCEFYYKKKLYSHCVAYSKPYAVKYLHDTKSNILDAIKKEAQKSHCTESFAVKGATLCAFYFARCMESGFYKLSEKSDDEMDDNDVLLNGAQNVPLKIYKACAGIEPALMVDLQQQRLHSEI